MFFDVFSIFDIYELNSMMNNKRMVIVLVMLLPMLVIILIMSALWMFKGMNWNLNKSFMKFMNDQCMRTKSYLIKSYSIIIISLFLTLLSVNMTGLISFTFSMSSQLIFTLSIALPMWLSLILSSFMYNKMAFMAHLLPDGAPLWLNPFLVLIETISIMVRPLTLSFRLAANMTAGHVVLCLMTSYLCIFMNCFNIQHLVLLTMSMVYVLFEVGICMIQGYIFQLLFFFYKSDFFQTLSEKNYI
uniref:ATP synthase subunit a n=1 Tax=Hirudinaria manillensis TaxID=1348078 RepID=X2C8Q0_HIRMN|nr:ATP synthase F0 subunit 6 [Hirudinaria manillensis]AGL34581.1 ATP synthase F0 subunit 6 [Hirudinaria manillensis]